MDNDTKKVLDWHEKDYSTKGFTAQRLYPNEELLRFLGRNYFSFANEHRKKIKILEVGCGSCSNLWMIAKEGFDAYGIDISDESILLGKKMLEHWHVNANLHLGSMHDMPYDNSSIDVVVDIVSSYCLPTNMFKEFIKEVKRILKKNGKFFIYTPSAQSDAFINYAPAIKIDDFTLNGIYQQDSAFYGNFYPFRFMDAEKTNQLFKDFGFEVNYCETTTKTYKNRKEQFQYISLEATLID